MEFFKTHLASFFALVCLTAVSMFSSPAYSSALVYKPENFKPKSAKVLVVIHGCFQTPESMALGTGFNQFADKENLVVLYPQVPTGSNPMDCWDWYTPANQGAKSGQLYDLKREILGWKVALGIKFARVYVAGLSSGAATAAGLLACFPKDFAAGALHSGPAYGLVSNKEEAEWVLKNGVDESKKVNRACDPTKFKKPVLVIQGTEDQVVDPKNVDQLIKDYFPTAKVAPATTAEAHGLKFKTEDYLEGKKLLGRVVRVEGLGHAWAGFTDTLRHSKTLGPHSSKSPTRVPFFTDVGPSSSRLIWDFFKQADN